MSASNTCAVCFGHRWQYFAARWKDDRLEGEWRQFDRGAWSMLGQQETASMLAGKTLRQCPSCNPNKLAPWSKSWRDAAAAPAADKAPDAPF